MTKCLQLDEAEVCLVDCCPLAQISHFSHEAARRWHWHNVNLQDQGKIYNHN